MHVEAKCVCFSVAHWFGSMCLIFLFFHNFSFFTGLNDGRLECNCETISLYFYLLFLFTLLVTFWMCVCVAFSYCFSFFWFLLYSMYISFTQPYSRDFLALLLQFFNVHDAQLLFLWLRGLNNRLQIALK